MIHIYFSFPGNCKEAMDFYEEVFQGKVRKLQTFGEAPANPNYPPLDPKVKDKILYGQLDINGSRVMFSDNLHSPITVGNSITVAYVGSDEGNLQKIFDKLSQDGVVHMPLGETFFSPCFGVVEDKFGISWQITLEK